MSLSQEGDGLPPPSVSIADEPGSAARRSRNQRRGMAILAMNITGRMPVPRRV